jgi:hypothetical protein
VDTQKAVARRDLVGREESVGDINALPPRSPPRAPPSLPSTPDLCLQDSRWSRRHSDVDVRIAHSSTVTNRSPLSIAVSLEGKTFRAAETLWGTRRPWRNACQVEGP